MNQKLELVEDSSVDKIKNNKQEVIDSIATETDMRSDEDRIFIEDAVDNIIIDEKFKHKKINNDKQLSTSFYDDINNMLFSNKVITHGVITDVSTTIADNLRIEIDVVNHNDEFKKKFRISQDEINDELENLFILLGINSAKPSELLGKKVPLNHKHRGHHNYTYSIHWPPSSGLVSKIKYKTNRLLRNKNLISLTGNNRYEFKYLPTIKLYFSLLMLMVLSLQIPGFAGGVLTCSILSIISVMSVIHFSELVN